MIRFLGVASFIFTGVACAGLGKRDDPASGPRSGGDLPKGAADADSVYRLYEIDAKAHPNAVCNDGSTPVFYVSRGGESHKWVIWFKGGAACSDEASCTSRSATLSSSAPWRRKPTLDEKSMAGDDEGKVGGILSSDRAINPDFHAWNRVYLPYCSSDEWIGQRSASPESFGLHFQGRAIALAIVDALSDPDIVGAPALKEATNILFAGSSAGANGLRSNIDLLASRLPGIDVRAFADAGITPEVTPVRGASGGAEAGMTARMALWKAEGDASCIEALDASDEWRCVEGFTLVQGKHLSTPTFHHMDQRDPHVMGDRANRDPKLAREAAAQIREVMSGVSGGFCPAFGRHTLLNDDKFSTLEVDGVSAADLFGNWYFDRSGPKLLVVDPGDETSEGGGNAERRGDDRGRKKNKKRE